MREPEFDPRFVDWLRDGPSAPSDWVLPAVEHHARRHPRRHALLARWNDAMKAVALRHPLTPAARAVAVVAVVAVAVGLGGLFLSRSPGLFGAPGSTPTPVSPTVSPSAPATPVLPAGTIGTWGPGRGMLSITLGACDASGVCGELRWRCHGESCVASLTYRGTTNEALTFEATAASSFGCGYDMQGSTVLVEPAADGLEVSTLGWSPGRSGVTLSRTDAPPGPSASPGG